jgi:hypothetical protein
MKKSFVKPLISSFLFLCILSSATLLAAVTVGVHEGDWIEYDATYTSAPPDYSIHWARLEISTVQETKITIVVTGVFHGDVNDTQRGTFDLEQGLPGLFIIPANLEVGNEFYNEDYGNVTIEGIDELTCVGSKRTAVYATVSQAKLYWDKTTGVLLRQEYSTEDKVFTLFATKTNMWQDQSVELVVGCALLIAVFVAFFLIRRTKQKDESVDTD